MDRPRYRFRQATLQGWWKVLPLILLPFGVLFFEAWVQTHILKDQYEINRLSTEVRALETSLAGLRQEQTYLVRMERMAAKAPDLGLVMPNPGQIEEIAAADGVRAPFMLARADAAMLEPLALVEPIDGPHGVALVVIEPLGPVIEFDAEPAAIEELSDTD